jgi:hypothetical protein
MIGNRPVTYVDNRTQWLGVVQQPLIEVVQVLRSTRDDKGATAPAPKKWMRWSVLTIFLGEREVRKYCNTCLRECFPSIELSWNTCAGRFIEKMSFTNEEVQDGFTHSAKLALPSEVHGPSAHDKPRVT